MYSGIDQARQRINKRQYEGTWDRQNATSIAEYPTVPTFVKYRCRTSDFDLDKTHPARAVDIHSQRFLRSFDEGARAISYRELVHTAHLRDEMLKERGERMMGRRRLVPHVIVEHCAECDCRIVKDGCKQLLDLLHRGQDTDVFVTEVSGVDWSQSIYDMRLACTCQSNHSVSNQSHNNVFIKIYGLQRSGTNYLEWLLRNNLKDVHVLVDETGWKHGFVPDTIDWGGYDWSDPDMPLPDKHQFAERRRHRLGGLMEQLVEAVENGELRYCIVSKDPYSWYASYARYTASPCSPVRSELIEHWCALNRHWYQYSRTNEARSCFLRYSDLLERPRDTIAGLCRQFGISFSSQEFRNCEYTMSAFEGTPQSNLFHYGYYLNRQYLEEFSKEDLALFAAKLPSELMDKLGYEIQPVNERAGVAPAASRGRMLSGDEYSVGETSPEKDPAVSAAHEPWLDVFYQAALDTRSGAFIDVGANVGQSLFKILRLDASRKYIGFEPQIEAASIIQQYLTLNKLSNHQVFPIGLSNKSGYAELYLHNKTFDRASSSVASIVCGFRPDDFYGGSKRIPVMTGDQVLPDLDLEEIALMKIDVEGAELEVIQGFEKTLQCFLPIIHFEVLNHYLIVTRTSLDDETIAFRERRVAELEALLRSLGYAIYQITRQPSIRKIKKIQPLKIPDQSNANYFAVHDSDNNNFTENLFSYDF